MIMKSQKLRSSSNFDIIAHIKRHKDKTFCPIKAKIE